MSKTDHARPRRRPRRDREDFTQQRQPRPEFRRQATRLAQVRVALREA